MKSLFSQYGTSGVTKLLLYTEGTENVSWVKGIDTQTGSGFGDSANTYTEGASFITLHIFNEPVGFITSNLAAVTDSTIDLTPYKRVFVDWEVISAGSFALIVDSDDEGDINDFAAKVTYGAGTGRKVSSVAINAINASRYVRINAFETTSSLGVETSEIRIHRVWLEK
jgi:hypothetical protein